MSCLFFFLLVELSTFYSNEKNHMITRMIKPPRSLNTPHPLSRVQEAELAETARPGRTDDGETSLCRFLQRGAPRSISVRWRAYQQFDLSLVARVLAGAPAWLVAALALAGRHGGQVSPAVAC